MARLLKFSLCISLAFLTGCSSTTQSGQNNITFSSRDDPNIDQGFDSHFLSEMQPSLWVDPFGCEHWIIDDGVEGYLINRMNRDGTPRCR